VAWRWTAAQRVDQLRYGYRLATIDKEPPGRHWYLVVGVYVLGGLVLFPVTILNVATVFTFGPILGNGYALAGWLASASMGYGVGYTIGRQMVQKLARSWFDSLIRSVDRHGFLTVLTLRVFPVAPFTLVNVFIGASGIRFRDFFSGESDRQNSGDDPVEFGRRPSRKPFAPPGCDESHPAEAHAYPASSGIKLVI